MMRGLTIGNFTAAAVILIGTGAIFLTFGGYGTLSAAAHRQTCTPEKCFIVLGGWLKYVESPRGLMGVRHAAGFLVAPSGKYLRVVKAPRGYSGTIGRLFHRPRQPREYTPKEIEYLKKGTMCVRSGKHPDPQMLDDCRSIWEFVLEARRERPQEVAKANERIGVSGYRAIYGFSCNNCMD